LWKNKEQILSAFEKNLTTNQQTRKFGFNHIDKALLEWFNVQRDTGFPINGPIFKIKAGKFAMQLEHKNYSCNNGWLDHFKINKICNYNTVKPLLTNLYGENHGLDKPISWMSKGKGNVVIDMKK
jgi:hypothetical protein